MSSPQINPDFAPVLKPLGRGAGDFFLAASLYHANTISFAAAAAAAAAAALAGLGYEEFHYRLKEHFGHGLAIDDDSVREDLLRVERLLEDQP